MLVNSPLDHSLANTGATQGTAVVCSSLHFRPERLLTGDTVFGTLLLSLRLL